MTVEVRPAFEMVSRGSTVRTISRDFKGGRLTFVRNSSPDDQTVEVVTDVDCADGMLMDAMDGWVEPVDVAAGGILTFNVPAWGSRLVLCGISAPSDLDSRAAEAPVDALPTTTSTIVDWSLAVEGDDVTDGSYSATSDALGDWRVIDALKYSSSTGVYTAIFSLDVEPVVYDVPTDERTVVYLDLGEVHGAALVSVNGYNQVEVISEPFRLDITDYVVSGTNSIEITLIPALRNRLVGLGVADDPTAAQFDKKQDTLVATGLVGPVTVESFVVPW